ncbi:hypothetical protein B0H16DRAFT_1478962 [Mycena metata]|uniref:Uncharacterized protein n=1 Tax=Mycena metata TaxID=1033252 RepID=A0AAD7H6F7_9AGAR|nr:hypothetical protein B0H16DRAFT_1478962 [Mycena metata]
MIGTHVPFTSFVSTVLVRSTATIAIALASLSDISRARLNIYMMHPEHRMGLERVFLAALIVAAKYTGDSAMTNVHWAACTGPPRARARAPAWRAITSACTSSFRRRRPHRSPNPADRGPRDHTFAARQSGHLGVRVRMNAGARSVGRALADQRHEPVATHTAFHLALTLPFAFPLASLHFPYPRRACTPNIMEVDRDADVDLDMDINSPPCPLPPRGRPRHRGFGAPRTYGTALHEFLRPSDPASVDAFVLTTAVILGGPRRDMLFVEVAGGNMTVNHSP